MNTNIRKLFKHFFLGQFYVAMSRVGIQVDFVWGQKEIYQSCWKLCLYCNFIELRELLWQLNFLYSQNGYSVSNQNLANNCLIVLIDLSA